MADNNNRLKIIQDMLTEVLQARQEESEDFEKRLRRLEDNHQNYKYKCTPLARHLEVTHTSGWTSKQWVVIIGGIVSALGTAIAVIINGI